MPNDAPRPIWSVMIPTYNCAAYLRETLHRVLQQAPPAEEMQIEVVDDHSTQDDPEAVVREVAGGRVAFVRQPKNVGHVANFNTCLRRSRGRLVHLLHGDDYVLPGFYERMRRPFDEDSDIGAAFCRHLFVDERGHWRTVGALLQERSGVLPRWLETIARGQQLQPPAIVVRRNVYERIGGFDARIRNFGEDWEIYVRIAAACAVFYETETLAAYRVHTSSLSGHAVRTGADIRDLVTVIELNRNVLPPERVEALTRRARRSNALGAIRRAHRALSAGDLRAPLVQTRGALTLSGEPRVWLAAANLLRRVAVAGLGHMLRRARKLGHKAG